MYEIRKISASHHWIKPLVGGILLLFLLVPDQVSAQCAMCRAVLESGDNTEVAEGINNGIVYLMAIPYILVGGLFYFIYRKMRA
ncbi:hypothetical protein PP178_01160 [Zeaxanthinibacter sp. PT1]|uniref:hypothetical protein n=1 Tax=Zeaxanthinibacter TaxID=561554 RepID=UPI002349ED10|nr:hypothetical protein [Zeaxanthinibacter sp. PT1]MDC6350146.1 hypothetical protein [Zeaxanthinibacter sp. PT1]